MRIFHPDVWNMTEGTNAKIYLHDEMGSHMQGDSQMVYRYVELGQDVFGNQREAQPFGYTGRVQQSWTTLAGASPVTVIASELSS